MGRSGGAAGGGWGWRQKAVCISYPLTLLAEVASNYLQLRGAQRQLAIAQQNLQSQQRTAEITRKRLIGGLAAGLDLANRLYTPGLTNFLNVLEAEPSLYTTEDALVQSHHNIALALVALYKALSVGWELTDQHPAIIVGQP